MTAGEQLADLLRALAPQVVGVLARRFGDFDAAEDAVQEAMLIAFTQWPQRGWPDNPRGWLIQAASRKLVDEWRSEQARRSRERRAALRQPAPADPEDERDDTLTVLFLCCHPSLTPASAIALTLRAVGGLTTAEIARAFLVPEATMAQRISRAKQRVKASGQGFEMPTGQEWPRRQHAVLRVLYLMFNEGYVSSGGQRLHRVELSGEAIRLTRMAHRLLPRDDEVASLLALMLLTDARRPASTDADGFLVPLHAQDRSRWDRALIAEGTALLNAVFARGAVGEFQLQAAIAALHARADRAEDTDWPQILALYGVLEQLTGNPMVSLGKAVAAAMVHGPHEGLRLVDALAPQLPGHYRIAAVRGHLYEYAGDLPAAERAYRVAAAATTSTPERHYLTVQAAQCRTARQQVRPVSEPSAGEGSEQEDKA